MSDTQHRKTAMKPKPCAAKAAATKKSRVTLSTTSKIQITAAVIAANYASTDDRYPHG